MAFRGLLGVQGVIPVSGPAAGGFTVNRLTGVWVDGGPAGGGGFSLNRLTGVWVDGASVVVDVEIEGGGGFGKVILPSRRRGETELNVEEIEEIVMFALLAIVAIEEIYYD